MDQISHIKKIPCLGLGKINYKRKQWQTEQFFEL